MVHPSDPPTPDFSRSTSQTTVTTIDSKDVAGQRVELVRSQSDVPHSWGDGRYEVHSTGTSGRERKESSASSVSASSTSAARENLRRMNSFWDATPEEIAQTLTKMEWDYFASLGVCYIFYTFANVFLASRYPTTYVDSRR
jgi:hypothetical protein